MTEPMVLATAGRFELLAKCDYQKYNTFCEELATTRSRGYNLCDACKFSVGLSDLLWTKAQYDHANRHDFNHRKYIREALLRVGRELVVKVGKEDLWNEYVELTEKSS